jgi:hypothetical protein
VDRLAYLRVRSSQASCRGPLAASVDRLAYLRARSSQASCRGPLAASVDRLAYLRARSSQASSLARCRAMGSMALDPLEYSDLARRLAPDAPLVRFRLVSCRVVFRSVSRSVSRLVSRLVFRLGPSAPVLSKQGPQVAPKLQPLRSQQAAPQKPNRGRELHGLNCAKTDDA